MACLRSDGNLDSARQRLRKVVIGGKSASRQDLRRNVGMMSSEQEESGEERMILRTSSVVVGEKELKNGGVTGGEICGEEREACKDERSLLILPLKRLRNAEGSAEDGIEEGSLGSVVRFKRLLREVQSLRGFLALDEIS